jgi:hypothetical protein
MCFFRSPVGRYLQGYFFLYPLEHREGEEDAYIATVTKHNVSTMAISYMKPGEIYTLSHKGTLNIG